MKLVQYNNQHSFLFVSGMFGGDWVWDRCREYINGANHLVMSEPLCALSHSVDDLIQLIVKAIDNHGKKVTLVGSSLGGMISLAIAEQFPDKVEKVLIAGTAGFEKVDLNIQLHPRRADAIADEIMSMVFHDNSMLNKHVLSSVAGEFRYNFKSIVNLIRESENLDGEKILQGVKCPVHAIWGRHDIVTPLSTVDEAFRRHNIPLTILEDCGHCPMYEKPVEFAQWVNDCMNDQAAVAA